MLLHYREHLTALEKQMDALDNELEEYKIIQSIPGIGEKIAATIISEIGEIDRFNHLKKVGSLCVHNDISSVAGVFGKPGHQTIPTPLALSCSGKNRSPRMSPFRTKDCM